MIAAATTKPKSSDSESKRARALPTCGTCGTQGHTSASLDCAIKKSNRDEEIAKFLAISYYKNNVTQNMNTSGAVTPPHPMDYQTVKRVPDGHWNHFSNHMAFRNYLAAKLELTKPEDWYTVSTDTIRKMGGNGLLNSKYKGQTLAFLRAVFPDVTWYPWLFKTPLKKFYENVAMQKLFLDWLAQKLSWATQEDYYKLTLTIITDNKGGGILHYHNSSPIQLLTALIPPPDGDAEWYPWKFDGSTPNNYWDLKENKLKYADWLYARLGFTKMEDWYTVNQDTFRDHYGSGLILNKRTYSGSHIAFLQDVYPDYTFYTWLFCQTSQGYWKIVENRLYFMKWLGELLEFKTVDDWYAITREAVYQNSGGGLLNHYYQDSLSRMIIELNPHLSFDPPKFLVYKTIAKLIAYLDKHGFRYQREYAIHPGKKNGVFRIDIYLLDLNICIELDGAQHFRQVRNWLSPVYQKKRDVFKMECMKEKGLRCIRLVQEEVLQHPESWLDMHLLPILCASEMMDPVYIVTLASNEGIYDGHKELYAASGITIDDLYDVDYGTV